ncbi:MFS transporter [Litoreibacter roseus]|uniref:MFS transporter n=1 Tax=Litoreibacter roseus TaxID=2601869 RepID=A0A6N6JAT4_9RHOB|nr:MFS transporter [Litoreibacter roseus]GFE63107.1 MFS transporter [Litoreibacter roseus]
MRFDHSLRLSRHTLPAFAAEGLVWGTFAAYVPEIKAAISASDAQFAMGLLVSSAGALLGLWIAPRFDQRVTRLAMPIAAIFMAAAFIGPAASTSLLIFIALMLFVGTGSGLLDVVMNARVSQIEAASGSSLMNLNHAGFSAAYGLAALACAPAREAGVPAWMMFTGILLIVLVCGRMMVLAPLEEDAPETSQSRKRLPGFVFWAGVIVLAGFLAEQSIEGWSALHLERTLGAGPAEGALGPALLGITMLIGRLSGQLVAAHLSERFVIAMAATLGSVGCIIAASASTVAMAYVGFALAGLGISVTAPMALALAGKLAPGGMRTHVISRTAMIGYMGFFVGPPLIGFVSEASSLRVSFLVVATILLFCLPSLILFQRAIKPSEQPGRGWLG